MNNNCIVCFPFENDLNDNCGNSWNISGNIELKNVINMKNNNKNFKMAAYFNDKAYMKSNETFQLSSMPSFGISFYIYNISAAINNQGIFDISRVLLVYKETNSTTKIKFRYRSSSTSTSATALSLIDYNCKLENWYRIIINYSNSTFYIYINDELILEKKIDSLNSHNNNITLGAMEGRAGESGWTFNSGYLKDFRFYNKNIQQEIKDSSHINTKRSILNNYKQINYKSFEFM